MSHSKVTTAVCITVLPTLPELNEDELEEECISIDEPNSDPEPIQFYKRMCGMKPQLRSFLVIVCVLVSLCVLVVQTHPTTSVAEEQIEQNKSASPDPESLPPDTFRKLAQALYHRGDRAPLFLERKFFYNRSVTCNDGSVAGYYIRRNNESKKWLIFLEGGWICHDPLSCRERYSREKHLMSSDGWPTVKSVGGILSADPLENPHLADANHVYVPYCSSDSWSGTASQKNEDGFTFMGRHIIREVVHELSDYHQLLYAEELFLAGSSAGATGVLVNVDYVADIMKNNERHRVPVAVRGIVDSGWFLDNSDASSVIRSLQQGIRTWQANVNDECAKNYPTDLWKCFIGYKAFPFIQTPLFVFQWQFDIFQLYAENVAVPESPEQWNYIHNVGSSLRSTFNDLSAVFSPACIAHEVLTKADWTEVVVDGVSLPDALSYWSSSLPDAAVVNTNLQISSSRVSSSGKIIQEDSNGLAANDGGRQRTMLADAPLKSRRHFELEDNYRLVNSNMLRNIAREDGRNERDSRNSINARLQTKKAKRKVVDNRTRFSSRREEKRQRRRQRQLRRCKEGDEVACKKSRANSQLIRSLDRRSSKGASNGKNNKKKLSRRERRKLRRRAKRQRRREKKRKRKNKKKAANNNRRSKREIRTKYIDSCSWPHCNRSCPRLENPNTGQEIDFLSLLKSFGSDMEKVARAIGVDMNTLNNMDKDVLLELLTSHGGISSTNGQL